MEQQEMFGHMDFIKTLGYKQVLNFIRLQKPQLMVILNLKTGATANTLILDASQNATFVGVIHTSKNGGAVAAISTPRIRLRNRWCY